jgi:hypothetical protein
LYKVVELDSRIHVIDKSEESSFGYLITPLSENRTIKAAFNFGWHGQENWSGIQTRWIQAEATILAISPENLTANLSLQALAFYRNRTLNISSRGAPVGQVVVPTSFVNMSMPIILDKGVNNLRLYVPEGCDRPSDITELNSLDSRCLSVAVRNLTLESGQ